MKKILIIINGFQLFHNDLNYAIHLAKTEKAVLHGLFVHNLKLQEVEGYAFPSDINLTDTNFSIESEREELVKLQSAQVKLFEDICSSGGVSFKSQLIHENFLDALIYNSAFADLVIINAEVDTTYYSLNSLLTNLYCPVLLLSKEVGIFDKIIIAYDGHSSSIHAMRQFAYLFTSWHHLPVYLVSVLPQNIREIEYKEQVQEWLSLQFPDAHINVLKGDVKEELPLFISLNQDAIVVMGAFGRSSLSRFFKESLANVVLAKAKTALFITHT
ncbi:universal stress protein [Chitinophagaceae bacterium LB-8]|uniref:Universal stress protein n=1 Tax=Paraflavisolibacter caeni TaxID=2982496 RepID=A0A9X2XVE9_9BACT|nr:universal stress protein [Paraflavisolibacter caeni]MCU7549286.1 universal stress protein [Paraflavisolibacter caeni]